MLSDMLNVLLVSKCKYVHGWHMEKHSHNFFHMFYIVRESGVIIIDGCEFKCRANDIYICPPDIIHEFLSGEKQELCTIEVKFLVDNETLKESILRLPMKNQNVNRKISMIFQDIINEAIHKQNFYKEIINHRFSEILLNLMRYNFSNEVKETVEFEHGIFMTKTNMGKLMNYINENISRAIHLDDLSKVANLAPGYLCKYFKRVYGMSPIHYINNLRLEKAKELMMHTDWTLTEIAEYLGFGSIHYFSRYFKEKERIPPNEFKKAMEFNAYIMISDKYMLDNRRVIAT